MADGYLEKKFEEFGQGAKKTVVKHSSIETLMEKNRSFRGYKKDYVVKREMLERIVAVNTKIASAKNQQVLRFKLVTKDTGADIIRTRDQVRRYRPRHCRPKHVAESHGDGPERHHDRGFQ